MPHTVEGLLDVEEHPYHEVYIFLLIDDVLKTPCQLELRGVAASKPELLFAQLGGEFSQQLTLK